MSKLTSNSNSGMELVDIRHLTDQMFVFTAAHVNVIKEWLLEQGVNVVVLGSKSKPLILVSPKEFEWAISQLAKRQELEARLQAGEATHG